MRLASLPILALALSLTLPAAAASHHKPKPGQTATSSKKSKHAAKSKVKASAASHAPMDTERATAIQTALIKQGYLTGEPSGTWDAQSAAAMQKMQSDNGWQTKIVPDSRAIIKLGLGPQASAAPAPNTNNFLPNE